MQIKNLSVNFKDNIIYKNFNINIEENKIICIIGKSGTGKTTLLNAISNLIEYKGELINFDSKVAYIFQKDRLVLNLTVKENLQLVCDDNLKIEQILKDIELYDYKDSYPKILSGGMARRVAIARAFCYDSKIILMDEPFSNLDMALKFKLINLIKKMLNKEQKTVFFVTHDLDEATMLSDRIILLDKGNIVLDVLNKDSERVKKEILKKIIE